MIFLDSGFIIALSNDRDEHNRRAMEIVKDIKGNTYGDSVITDYIFDEVLTSLLARVGELRMAVRTGEGLLGTTSLIGIDPVMFSETWNISQRNPRLSFTDCSTIATCRANGIERIATFDKVLGEESRLEVVR